MPDWTKSMQQTYEFYIVDPNTWRDVRLLDNVISCNISRDSDAETLGSASFEVTDSIGEMYIRVYLVTIQDDIKERHPLGTYLAQTPSSSFNGKVRTVTMDAYTPLLELKENTPPVGYFIPKGMNIMDAAYQITNEHMRAPVVSAQHEKALYSDFVADTNDTWLSFVSSLIRSNRYDFELDENGRVLFAPYQELDAMQPVWTFNDDNSSILFPDITWDHDLYGIPNVVEVSFVMGLHTYTATARNEDPNSPVSIPSRGREIIYRVSENPLTGYPSTEAVEEYAEQLLTNLSEIQYTVSYTHGYCPVRIGDCVRLNYTSAGLTGIKARVTKQTINCEPGCSVSETAVFTRKLYGGNV